MEIRVLRYFIAVVKHGSVAAASRQVHVAQPSVSRQLKGLEKELGVALFDRGQGALRLSPAGERFLPVAADLVSRHETATRLFSQQASHEMRLLVVAQSTTEKRLLAPFTAAMGAKYPHTDVLNETPMNVFATVDSSHADIGVTTTVPPTGWEVRYLSEAPLNVHVPADHPLADKTTIDITQLARHPLILMTAEHSARTVFDHAVATAKTPIERIKESQSSIMAQAAAASGRGAAVLTDEPQFGLSSVRITQDGEAISFPIYAGWKQHHYATETIDHWARDLAAWIARNPELAL